MKSKLVLIPDGPNRFFSVVRIREFDLSISRSKTVSTMCCSVRGPAILPCLIAWPTMKMMSSLFLVRSMWRAFRDLTMFDGESGFRKQEKDIP